MSDSVIELADVTFCRASRTILDSLSWRIDSDQHWALLGANGSGKTTLLKIITGYEWPTTGKVRVLGNSFGQCSLPQLRKTVGYVTNSITEKLPGKDTSIEVVLSGIAASFGLYRQFTDSEIDSALQTLEMVSSADFANQTFETLSQGEKQRILIARALVSQPELLILDEPCVGLDPAARDTFLADIANLTKQQNSPRIILVTHHIEEIGDWITHIHLLKDGKTLGMGPADDMLRSQTLTDLFDCQCDVEQNGSGWRLIVNGRGKQ